jgi:hypothetical protein
VVEDWRETGVRRWRTKAVGRNEWQRILQEAWVLLGPSGTVASRTE